ncbi:hypothetical protein GTA09_15325 [Rhodococcus hoagii]|nr:hypothetical protein [Prescottella equi]NKZ71066.1 hypothetical protein [Prescottella equi]
MRLHSRNLTPEVTVDPDANRPVTLRFAGLRVAMTGMEARQLADNLVDAAEEADR